MARGYKSFMEILNEAKQVIAEHNVSFDEISENTGVDSEFVRILFDDTTKTGMNIDEIFEFLKLKFVSKKLIFRPYAITNGGNQIKIKRLIKPVCQMYYDRGTDNFYKFSFKLKTYKTSETYIDILKSEMKDLIYNHLEKML